jgi:hypothetical protein
MPDDRARLNERRRDPYSDQDDHRRHNRNRSRRVHCNAQRATVSIAVQGVYMRYLNHGQQCQQGQTQQSGCTESAWLPAANSAEICLQPCQQIIPCFKDTQYWTRQER